MSTFPRSVAALLLTVALSAALLHANSTPVRTRHGMVVSQQEIASSVGAAVLSEGGNAVDAAVATAFALAVTHPTAGNIGGGGFLLYRARSGDAISYDFRETAPAASSPTMFVKDGKYDPELHHHSHLSVGVPGTVAGLHMAWRERGSLPWRRLVKPAITLARNGFVVTEGFARSLEGTLEDFKKYPASYAQFTRNNVPYAAGDIFQQPDLALTLERIASRGPAGFYEGETADLIQKEMAANRGLITKEDLKNYKPITRQPLRGTYRGHEILSVPPASSGGVALIEMLNVLEGYDLASSGAGSARTVHVIAETMRRAYADRARSLGDPAFNPTMPTDLLISKPYAVELRKTIRMDRASKSSPTSFDWLTESAETTHISVVDKARNAVSLTYTLEEAYGAKIVVRGAGFLLNNEMGDFNAMPGLTTSDGLIGTTPNMAAPGKRMLSSMTPTIVVKDGVPMIVTGTLGGRTIINTVLLTILNVIDFGMNAQQAVDAPRLHHQWLPDQIVYERNGLSPDTLAILEQHGHTLRSIDRQGVAEVIVYDKAQDILEGGVDRRAPDGAVGLAVKR